MYSLPSSLRASGLAIKHLFFEAWALCRLSTYRHRFARAAPAPRAKRNDLRFKKSWTCVARQVGAISRTRCYCAEAEGCSFGAVRLDLITLDKRVHLRKAVIRPILEPRALLRLPLLMLWPPFSSAREIYGTVL